jgi:hypothetical protein
MVYIVKHINLKVKILDINKSLIYYIIEYFNNTR